MRSSAFRRMFTCLLASYLAHITMVRCPYSALGAIAGTSSQVPTAPCLTADPPTCKTCFDGATSPLSHNRRRNTSVLVRAYHPNGRLRNILIDCGKVQVPAELSGCWRRRR